MANVSGLDAYKTVYILVRETHRVRTKMLKALKYEIGQEMMLSGLRMTRGIILAAQRQDKVAFLQEALAEGEVMWTWLRLGFDLKGMSAGELRLLSQRLDELMKQLAAWLKWSRKQNDSD